MPVTKNHKLKKVAINLDEDIMGLQLKSVFNLCDPKATGHVSIEHLLALATHYCGHSKVR